MEQFDFPTAQTRDIVSTFLNQSCVLLRNFVDAAALDRAYDMTSKNGVVRTRLMSNVAVGRLRSSYLAGKHAAA